MITEDLFWRLIEDSKAKSYDNLDHQADLLISELEKITEREIVGFDFRFIELMNLANSTSIYAAYAIINCIESDDGFEYFRAWLIGQGYDTYYRTIENPDILADLITIRKNDYDDFILDQEELLYVAQIAYQNKTGQEMVSSLPNDIRQGEKRYFSEWLKLYPKLTEKFWPRCEELFKIKIKDY